jgi:Uma2 family endonuclease
MTSQQLLDAGYSDESDEIVTELDISHLVIEDDTPVDDFQSAQQQRLLVEPLYSSQALPSPFLAEANVGLFYKLKGDPVVPDALLSLGVQRADDYSERRNRSYFVWEFGKVPDVCIEVVSNQEGNEVRLSRKAQQEGKTQSKKDIYAQIHVPYYVVFDPLEQIQDEANLNGALLRVWTIAAGRYTELTPAAGLREAGQFVWLEEAGIGLMLWEGQFEEDVSRLWLRWCDRDGSPIPTGAEGMAVERLRADIAQQQADAERERAEAAQQQAEAAQQQAASERERAERLAERLRSLGINPEEV